MAKKYKGPKREDGHMIHSAPPMEFRAFTDEEGRVEVYVFVDGYEAGELRYSISSNQVAGLRQMFREWDAAGK
jgi:hypothetical protein